MPDFDANYDPLRLTGAEQDEPLEPAHIRPPHIRPRFVARARELACSQCYARYGRPARRVGVAPVAHRRRAARRACPSAGLLAPLRTSTRRRRRLWTMCHGRPPGSPS